MNIAYIEVRIIEATTIRDSRIDDYYVGIRVDSAGMCVSELMSIANCFSRHGISVDLVCSGIVFCCIIVPINSLGVTTA